MGAEVGVSTVDSATGHKSVDTSIRVFGGVGVDGPNGPVSIGGPRQRRLLALLAARPGTVLSRDWSAEYLWDDADRPGEPTSAIRTYFSRLRQALPEEAQDWVETAPSGYRFTAPPDAIEHLRFVALRAAATRARDHEDPQRALHRSSGRISVVVRRRDRCRVGEHVRRASPDPARPGRVDREGLPGSGSGADRGGVGTPRPRW